MITRWLPVTGLMVVLAGCGSSSTNASSSTGSTSAGGAVHGIVSSVSSVSSKYGQILASTSGYTYYIFEPDTAKTSACYGACAKVWPPVTVASGASPETTGGVNKSLVGTITRTGGSKQITYDGHPLYTFTGDSGPNLTNGQGIDHFGGYWYVIAVSGQPVTATAASASPTTSKASSTPY